MALNIKNKEAEQLAAEMARMTDSSMTAVIIEALRRHRERLLRLKHKKQRLRDVRHYLEHHVWSLPDIDPDQMLGQDELLGFGEGGA